jgi:hypothetical protein
MNAEQSIRTISARAEGLSDWQHWVPYAAVAWSLIYAALGAYWAVSGQGFPYASELAIGPEGPLAGRFGPIVGWIIVIALGLPAAAMGIAMLRGVKRSRPLLITAGALIGLIPLLAMVEFSLLIELAYVPYMVFNLIMGSEFGRTIVQSLLQSKWTIAHQLVCLNGGFLWLAATVVYTRRSGEACLYCGRRDGPAGWNSPEHAARWGRIAVYVAMVPPIFYTITRYAWALGIPWGMSMEHLRAGQVKHTWTSGLFLASFSLVGALLMLGLVQRWGEVFPRWIPFLGGKQVPMPLAIIPAAIVSVLFMVGGIATWSGLPQMNAASKIVGESIVVFVGPLLLFPIWSAALAVATLGYYFRRRGPCGKCHRGAATEAAEQAASNEEVYTSAGG